MDKKYELTNETKVVCGVTLYRIKALRSFGNVMEGDLGGYIEKEDNLSHDGDAWVSGNARVFGNALVFGDARVFSNAKICSGADYLCFKGLGSENRNTTFFKCDDETIKVKCGCFFGTLTEFEQKVKETHGDSKYAKEYLACVEVVKIHFEIGEDENG